MPVPLVDIEDMKSLDMSSSDGKQLLLNYCFGHPKSSLVLCPTTTVTLVNHHSRAANAELKWTTSSNMEDEYNTVEHLVGLNGPLPSQVNGFNTRLMLTLVASRDIQPGEEIFLGETRTGPNARRTLEATFRTSG